MNDMVRQAMFGETNAPIHLGEILTAYDNFGYFLNSLDYRVVSIKDEKTVTVTTRFGNVTAIVQPVSLRGENQNQSHFVQLLSLSNDYNVYNQIVSINKQFHAAINADGVIPGSYIHRLLKKEFAEFRASFVPMRDVREDKRVVLKKQFDFGYALTTHKSQGSTYD
jgi:hypothetical protein